jgi:RNA polymerase sigma factor (sigma-70 family)
VRETAAGWRLYSWAAGSTARGEFDLPPTSAKKSAEDVQLPELTTVVRRVIAARVVNPDNVDDLVQETLARVWEASPRLDPEAVTPYAIVTAQNLVRSLARSQDTRRRHSHRLVDPREPVRPEDEAVRKEEAAAVATALARLPSSDRDTVVAHEVGGVDTATLARRLDSSPGGVAVKLARARAKLRVEYVMALRKAEAPTRRCRSVLIALSSADQRRQIALKAGEHLLECSYCAELSEPLIERRRSLAGLAPVAAVAKSFRWVRHAAHSGSVQATAAVTTVAAVGIAAVMASHHPSPPKPSPRVSSQLTTEKGANLRLLPHGLGLKRYAGRAVEGHGIRVVSVPADEGFWIDAGKGDRVWIQRRGAGESGAHVKAGDRVTFHGRVVANDADFTKTAGVSAREGAALLRREGYHISIRDLMKDRG